MENSNNLVLRISTSEDNNSNNFLNLKTQLLDISNKIQGLNGDFANIMDTMNQTKDVNPDSANTLEDCQKANDDNSNLDTAADVTDSANANLMELIPIISLKLEGDKSENSLDKGVIEESSNSNKVSALDIGLLLQDLTEQISTFKNSSHNISDALDGVSNAVQKYLDTTTHNFIKNTDDSLDSSAQDITSPLIWTDPTAPAVNSTDEMAPAINVDPIIAAPIPEIDSTAAAINVDLIIAAPIPEIDSTAAAINVDLIIAAPIPEIDSTAAAINVDLMVPSLDNGSSLLGSSLTEHIDMQ